MEGSGTKTILVINGPNLNILGKREPEKYGTETLDEINQKIMRKADRLGVKTDFLQSNHEGEIVDKINSTDAYGIIINPAAYTHTSIAIKDALTVFEGPVIEVHLSNILSREEYRQKSITASSAIGVICGFGGAGYILALEALTSI